MSVLFQFFILAAMLAVVIALFFGLRNMMKGGDANLSNKLMQLRVFFQFVAVVLIVMGILIFWPDAG